MDNPLRETKIDNYTYLTLFTKNTDFNATSKQIKEVIEGNTILEDMVKLLNMKTI